ncbi:MAG: hypothetical protein ACPG7F_01255 [Aggregatilineales bacterium]
MIYNKKRNQQPAQLNHSGRPVKPDLLADLSENDVLSDNVKALLLFEMCRRR